ncbi:MAG: O-antigen ligase family protein [Bryobacteraceae bacterium]
MSRTFIVAGTSASEAACAGRAGRTAMYAAVIGAAAVLSLAMLLASGMDGRGGRIAVLTVACGALLPVLVAFPGLVERGGLLALGMVLPVSLKFHLAYREDHFGGAVGYRIAAADLLLVALAGWALLHRSGGFRIHVPTPLLMAFGVYLFFAAISAAAGSDPELGLFQLSALLQAFVLFVFLSNFLHTRARFRLLVAGILAGLALQSAVALVQVHRPGAVSLAFLGAAEAEERREVRGRIDLPAVDRGTTMLGGSVTERPTGTLIHPNVLALYLVLAIALAAGVWITDDGWLSWFAFGALSLGAVAMYYTLSRSGWAGLVLSCALAAGLCVYRGAARVSQAKALMIAIGLCAALVGLAAKADRIAERLASSTGEAVEFRAHLNTAAVGMLLDNPFTGVGLNNCINHILNYDISGLSRIKPYPVHNLILLEFSETGLAGGLSFLALLWILFRTMWRSALACGSQRSRALAIFAMCGFAGFLLGDMTNFVYRIPVMTAIVWAHAGLVVALGRSGGETWSL